MAGDRRSNGAGGATSRLSPSPAGDAGAAAIRDLYRAADAVRHDVERSVLAEPKLTRTAWILLSLVWLRQEVEIWHAAAQSALSKSTVAGALSVLETRGLIRRAAFPADGRRVLVSLTTGGLDLVTGLYPEVVRHEERAVASLSADEIGVLTDALLKIADHLGFRGGIPAAPTTA